MHLHAERGDLDAGIGGEGLGDRRQQLGARRCRCLRRMARPPARGRRRCARARSRWRGCASVSARMVRACAGRRDGRRCGLMPSPLAAGRAALPALAARRRAPAAARARRCATPWTPTQAGVVHHREHAGEAAMSPRRPASRRRPARAEAAVAIDHGAGRRAVDAELVLEARAERRRCARRACRRPSTRHLRHQEERDAARAGRRVGQPRQHEMHDVVGKIVLAIGDEDLLAEDAVGAVAGGVGARL